MKKRIAYVLGGGIVGLWTAFWLRREGFEVFVIDRNHPFELMPIQQTSFAGIGIIENPLMAPLDTTSWAYLESRRIYAWLMKRGFGYIRSTKIRYYTNEDNFLDGPGRRSVNENYRTLSGDDLKGFAHGDEFTNYIVPTTLFNDSFRTYLCQIGVRFLQSEITDHPGIVRLTQTDEPEVVVDCRGMGIPKEQIGCQQRPKSGQTVMVWAPPHLNFDYIVGNPGRTISYNIVPWAFVSAEVIRILNLGEFLKPKDGGQILILGATKMLDDYGWDPLPVLDDAIVNGCTNLDQRIGEVRVLRSRKGQRATLPEGVLDQTRVYGNRVVRWLGGAAGNAYCFMPAYTRMAAKEIVYLASRNRSHGGRMRRMHLVEQGQLILSV